MSTENSIGDNLYHGISSGKITEDFHIAIMVPSYKREKWLLESFIDNYYYKIVEPLNKSLNGRVTLLISVQDTSSEWEALILNKIKGMEHLSVEFTNIDPLIKISQIRCEIIDRAINNIDGLTHIMLSDDDLWVHSSDRLIPHFRNLLESKNFLERTTVFNVKPCVYYGEEELLDASSTFDRQLNLIRFQCFPLSAYTGMLQAIWFSKKNLYSVNNGEDTIIASLVYVYLYSKYGGDAKFLNVFGFDEMLHLSEGALTKLDVFSPHFKGLCDRIKAKSPNFPEVLIDYSLDSQTFKEAKGLIDAYGLKSTGFHWKGQILDNYRSLSRSYQDILDKWATPVLTPDNISKFMGRHINTDDIYNCGNESLNEGSGNHVRIIIPSYRREEWLKKLIPDLHSKVLKGVNTKSDCRLSCVIYVQNSSELDFIKDIPYDFSDLITVKLVDKSNYGETMSSLRCRFAEEELNLDSTITHILMADDDLYINGSGESLIDGFTSLFNSKEFKRGDLILAVPCRKDGGIPNRIEISQYRFKEMLWLIRFQIIPKEDFMSIFNSKYIRYSDLMSIDAGEDEWIFKIAYINKLQASTVVGFYDLLHIGGENHVSLPMRYKSVVREDLIKMDTNFNFDVTGYTPGRLNENHVKESENIIKKYMGIFFNFIGEKLSGIDFLLKARSLKNEKKTEGIVSGADYGAVIPGFQDLRGYNPLPKLLREDNSNHKGKRDSYGNLIKP